MKIGQIAKDAGLTVDLAEIDIPVLILHGTTGPCDVDETDMLSFVTRSDQTTMARASLTFGLGQRFMVSTVSSSDLAGNGSLPAAMSRLPGNPRCHSHRTALTRSRFTSRGPRLSR